jgi:hypothetical protein
MSLVKIDLRHIPLDLPIFPDSLKPLGAGDAFGLDRLLVLDGAAPFLRDLHLFLLGRSLGDRPTGWHKVEDLRNQVREAQLAAAKK